MTDYQFIAYRDVAPIREVGVADIDVPTLDIRGKEFIDVTDVMINGYRSSEFVTLSRRHILAQIPTSQRGQAIRSVEVLTAKSGQLPAALILLSAAVNRRVEGWPKLAQAVLKVLLTRPGSDIFQPSIGGGLLQLVGTASTEGELTARATLAVENTQNQIIQVQAEETGLPSSEKLRGLTLLGVNFDKLASALSIRLRITAFDGSTSDLNFSV